MSAPAETPAVLQPQAVPSLPLASRYQLTVAAPARVTTGQVVTSGCPLGSAGAVVHAPVCGTVSSVDALPGQRLELTITTDPAATAACTDTLGLCDPAHRLPALVPARLTGTQLTQRLHEAGIVGLGGGAFPSADKLQHALQAGSCAAVVANAVSCEPGIDADAAVLADGIPLVLAALEGLAAVCGVRPVVALGAALEPCHEILTAAIDAAPVDLQLLRIPAAPAAGAETVLLEQLYGWRGYDGRRPSDDGYLTYNLTTLLAMGAALLDGEPLVQRPITLPSGNRWVRIGHPLAELGVDGPLRSGGELSGRAVERSGAIDKGTLAIHPLPTARAAQPCISCAQCQPACPVGLDPEALHRSVLRVEGAPTGNLELLAPELDHCIECGYCNPACPSDIDLLADLRLGRSLRHRDRAATAAAERAQLRFEAHEARAQAQAEDAERRRRERLEQRTRRSSRWQQR
ncbi:MAG: 4Fe-4S dicluster domain-containing protein [Pseudomonadota bacterium]